MVLLKVWNKEDTSVERRNNLKFADAMETLRTVKSIGVAEVIIFNEFTDSSVKVVSAGNYDYLFHFTYKQLKSIMEELTALNGGNDIRRVYI